MGSLASLPDSVGDFFSGFADLVVALADGLKKIVDYFPDLVKGIIDLFENLVLLLKHIVSIAHIAITASKLTLFVAPAIAVYYLVESIIDDLGLN